MRPARVSLAVVRALVRARPHTLVPTLIVASLCLASSACGGSMRRFPLRDPMWTDTDTRPVSVACRPDPEDPEHRLCLPQAYESPFAWDGADNLVFRSISRFFAVDPGGESVNVNAFDEVPDSSWFVNRIGRAPMSIEDVVQGSCPDIMLDPEGPDGSWLIDQGKPNGANPGFRIRVEGVGKFMLKTDLASEPERATGATSIASRIYYAAGWWAPCDTVIYVRPELLRLKEGLEYTDNTGVTRPFDEAKLQEVLENASRRDGRVRMVASMWLPGRTIGPFRYEGTREDDPNDVIPHEDRRDLRGARVIAAWLNHFDTREQNSMDTWMSVDEEDKESSPGHVRHWYIDLGDCFGSRWEIDGISRRLGHAYYLDVPYVAEDFVTFGVIARPWDRARVDPVGDIFGYFHARDFDPELWRGGYPNPAFQRMTEHDAAWATRILSRFTDAHIAAAVRVGDYTLPRHSRFLEDQLEERLRIIMRRYFAELSPVADLRVTEGQKLCGRDLARWREVYPAETFRYSARMYTGEEMEPHGELEVESRGEGEICVPLTHFALDARDDTDAGAERYAVVDIANGQAEGLLRAHLYDLGAARGFRLVGVERTEDDDEP